MVRQLRKFLPKDQRKIFDTDLKALLESEKDYLTDRVTNGHILFVASVLCAWRTLRRGGASDQDAKRILGHSLRGLGRRSTAFLLWLTCTFRKDAFETIQRYSRAKSQYGYGPSFQITESEIVGGFVSEVHICGYRSFLARHHALDLAEVLCEWDRVWIEALPKTIRFRRPTTLARGDASCRFEFRRK